MKDRYELAIKILDVTIDKSS